LSNTEIGGHLALSAYRPSSHATSDPTPVNLLPTQPEPADRYYSVNSRDFTTV